MHKQRNHKRVDREQYHRDSHSASSARRRLDCTALAHSAPWCVLRLMHIGKKVHPCKQR